MSQKELLYVEDIFNHEVLIINIIEEMLSKITDDKYISLFEAHLKEHENVKKKIIKLVEGEC